VSVNENSTIVAHLSSVVETVMKQSSGVIAGLFLMSSGTQEQKKGRAQPRFCSEHSQQAESSIMDGLFR
jgi:hypothetical protein